MGRSRSRGGWAAAIVVTVALVLAGCGDDAGPAPGAELVGSRSQGGPERDWVEDAMPIETVLIASAAELEEWLETQPGDAGAVLADRRDVDLEANVLVIGGYGKCQEYSVVLLHPETGDVEFVVTVADGDEQIACAWSPYTIDAWAVPLEATGGEVPELVTGTPETS